MGFYRLLSAFMDIHMGIHGLFHGLLWVLDRAFVGFDGHSVASTRDRRRA